ncbi:TPA: helix-turn-helix domain-containing protein [Streptococcus suis]
MGFGKIMKSIRMNKGLSQSESAKGILTVSQLSKFENEQVSLTINRFFDLLKRYNTSPQEFFRMIDDNQSQDNFISRYYHYYNSNNIEGLNDLLEEQRSFLSATGNIRHRHNVIQIQQKINQMQNIPINRSEIKVLYDYLMKVEVWWGYEYTLVSSASSLMDPGFLSQIGLRLLKQMRTTLLNNDRTMLTIYNNIVFSIVMSPEYQKAATLIKYFEKNTDVESTAYYEMNKANFIRGLYYLKIGESQKGMKLVEDAKNIFLTLKQFDTWKRHEAYLEEVVKSIQTS